MTHTEAQIEQQITTYLSLKGWIVLKTDAGMAARHGGRGRLPVGTPDLIALKQGRGIALEVKTATGKITEIQKFEHIRYAKAGVPCEVVRSLEDVQELEARLEVMR